MRILPLSAEHAPGSYCMARETGIVQPSMEFADDQDHVSALELQPDAPWHRMLEEKVLARQASEWFNMVSHQYYHTAGYQMSLQKCYSMWDTSLCPYIAQKPKGAVTDAEIVALGLEYNCAGCGR